jgi:hypothetical protein
MKVEALAGEKVSEKTNSASEQSKPMKDSHLLLIL